MKKVITIFVILIGVLLFLLGRELLGIIAAIVGLFFLPSSKSISTMDDYFEKIYEEDTDETDNNSHDHNKD